MVLEKGEIGLQADLNIDQVLCHHFCSIALHKHDRLFSKVRFERGSGDCGFTPVEPYPADR